MLNPIGDTSSLHAFKLWGLKLLIEAYLLHLLVESMHTAYLFLLVLTANNLLMMQHHSRCRKQQLNFVERWETDAYAYSSSCCC